MPTPCMRNDLIWHLVGNRLEWRDRTPADSPRPLSPNPAPLPWLGERMQCLLRVLIAMLIRQIATSGRRRAARSVVDGGREVATDLHHGLKQRKAIGDAEALARIHDLARQAGANDDDLAQIVDGFKAIANTLVAQPRRTAARRGLSRRRFDARLEPEQQPGSRDGPPADPRAELASERRVGGIPAYSELGSKALASGAGQPSCRQCVNQPPHPLV